MQLQLYGKKIWFYQQPVDFRRSIDGLVAIISKELKQNPQESIYLFYNRDQSKIKCLSWHRNGYLFISFTPIAKTDEGQPLFRAKLYRL